MRSEAEDELRREGAELFAEFISNTYSSYKQAADDLGVSPAFISYLCSGSRSIPDWAAKLAGIKLVWVRVGEEKGTAL